MPLRSEEEKKPAVSRHEEYKVKFSQATNTGSCAKQVCTDLARARITNMAGSVKGQTFLLHIPFYLHTLLNECSLLLSAPLSASSL